MQGWRWCHAEPKRWVRPPALTQPTLLREGTGRAPCKARPAGTRTVGWVKRAARTHRGGWVLVPCGAETLGPAAGLDPTYVASVKERSSAVHLASGGNETVGWVKRAARTHLARRGFAPRGPQTLGDAGPTAEDIRGSSSSAPRTNRERPAWNRETLRLQSRWSQSGAALQRMCTENAAPQSWSTAPEK